MKSKPKLQKAGLWLYQGFELVRRGRGFWIVRYPNGTPVPGMCGYVSMGIAAENIDFRLSAGGKI